MAATPFHALADKLQEFVDELRATADQYALGTLTVGPGNPVEAAPVQEAPPA